MPILIALSSIHICVTLQHASVAQEFVKDVKDAVQTVSNSLPIFLFSLLVHMFLAFWSDSETILYNKATFMEK